MRISTKLLGVSCGLLLAGAGCGNSGTPNECAASDVSGTNYKFATNALKLPSSSAKYSIDIDGDTKAENQLQAIASAIGAAGFDLNGPINDAVKAGEAVVLTEVQAADLTTGCSRASLSVATPTATGQPAPKYDGTDNFSILSGQTPANLYGMITGSKLNTTLPPQQTQATVQKLALSLPLASGMLPLTIYGAHVQGTLSADKILNGEIHGVIRKTDIDTQIIPAVASLLTDEIHKAPTGSTAMTIINLFEDMSNPATKTKCMTASMCCHTSPTTCVILPAEVAGNSLIQNVLAPDVQCFDGSGNWAPVAKGATKDSMSVGLGFTSVKDNFQ